MLKRNFFISVAMATYNGEDYIKEQIASILENLSELDELIISDDGSSDNTLSIIASFHDARIKVLEGPKKGVKQNFANAITHSKGRYIFLADQDDIWEENKVSKVLRVFSEENCSCVVHDCVVVNKDLAILMPSFFEHRNSKSGIISNIYKNKYLGCCMAFHQDMKKYILPIPDSIEMHDQWIGILSEKYGKSIFVQDKLLKYRRHGKNASEMYHYPFIKMIRNRVVLVKELWKRMKNK